MSKLTKTKSERWSAQGLYIFLLPSYSPELNRIENEWQRIKEDELASPMFVRLLISNNWNWEKLVK